MRHGMWVLKIATKRGRDAVSVVWCGGGWVPSLHAFLQEPWHRGTATGELVCVCPTNSQPTLDTPVSHDDELVKPAACKWVKRRRRKINPIQGK